MDDFSLTIYAITLFINWVLPAFVSAYLLGITLRPGIIRALLIIPAYGAAFVLFVVLAAMLWPGGMMIPLLLLFNGVVGLPLSVAVFFGTLYVLDKKNKQTL